MKARVFAILCVLAVLAGAMAGAARPVSRAVAAGSLPDFAPAVSQIEPPVIPQDVEKPPEKAVTPAVEKPQPLPAGKEEKKEEEEPLPPPPLPDDDFFLAPLPE